MKRIDVPSLGSFPVVGMVIVVLLPSLTSCDINILGGDFDLEYSRVTVNLTGKVVAANDGTPLPGVTVQQRGGTSADTAVTNSDGHYRLTVVTRCPDLGSVPCRGLSFVAHLEGFERGFEPQSLDIDTLNTSEPLMNAILDFSLRSTRPITVTVHGKVTSSTGGPIAAARIYVHDSWAFFFGMPVDSTVADSVGMYRIVTTDLCAMSGDSCFVSLGVWAESGSRLESRSFDDVNVFGDSLVLSANFQNLQ